MKSNKQNQQNPPLPKRKRVDTQGNDGRRIFAKSGTATLEIAKVPSENAAVALMQSIRDNTKRIGGYVTCNLFCAR